MTANMTAKEHEAAARARLDAAREAVQEYRRSVPAFTPVPEHLFDELDAARIAHDAAYAAAYDY